MRRKVKFTLGVAAMAMGILCGTGGGKLLSVMAASDATHEAPSAYTRSYEDTTATYTACIDEL